MTRRAPLALALLLAPAVAAAGDFIDTTITFVASDDNVMAGAGETIPSSPAFDFRPRKGNSLFFENYNRRDTGEETRTHLVLYKAFEGYFDGLTPEAAMVLEWDANRNARTIERYGETTNRDTFAGIRDKGSYLALNWALGSEGAPERLSLVLFPFDSDRFRLGYSWELTWAGNKSFLDARRVPGARLSYQWKGGYVFAGAKMVPIQTFTESEHDPERDEWDSVYGFLAGGGLWFGEHLQAEIAGAYIEKGNIPLDRVAGRPLEQYGASAQITWTDGIPPQTPIDTKLLRNPGTSKLSSRWKRASFGYLVSAEGSVTSQNLEDFNRPGTTKREWGYAGDLNAVVRDGAWSLNLDLVLRDFDYMLQDDSGFFPFSTLSSQQSASPEIFAALGADYYFEALHLQPGLTFGVQAPATVEGDFVLPDGSEVHTSAVVRRTKDALGGTYVDAALLPSGEGAVPVFSGQLTLRADLSDLVTVVGEAQLSYDRNLVTLDATEGVRRFETPWILGLSLLAQARF